VVIAVAGVIVIGAVFGVASATTGHSFWSRVVAWQESDFGDWRLFPSRPVANDPMRALTLSLSRGAADPWPWPVSGGSTPLEEQLASSGTAAFIVLRGDEIAYERYFNGYTADSTMTSFSTAKSFVSALVGAAIADGAIESVDVPITTYLPELEGRGLDEVTIADLLAMASGIAYDGGGAGGLPWQDDAKTYYDPELRTLALGVQPEVPPSTRWEYNNYHPILLGIILERATGTSVADYLSNRIWRPVGMEAPASWSLDSVEDGLEKMESGINARARDFARFGVLYARDGRLDGQQILPAEWVAASTTAKVATDYGYFWWLGQASDEPAFAARGNLGQLIFVVPATDVVVVRFGERYGDIDWMALAGEVAAQASLGHR
jgi:CubicO group peptidase (beta-lactamase class C family)